MRKVLVTGATGFIGSALVRRLLKEGVSVRAMCRSAHKGESLRQVGAEIVLGDLQNPATCLPTAEGCDVIFHVGAALDGRALLQYNTNVLGTQAMLQAAKQAHVARFVHVSSIAVYGPHVYGTVDESTPHRPSSQDFYQQTKAMGEEIVWKFAQDHHLAVSCVRPAMVYGPGAGFWSRTLYNLCRTIPVPVVGDGQGLAHPIYVDDLVELLVLAGSHPNAVGQAFNGSPDPVPTWVEWLSMYAAMAGNQRRIYLPLEILRLVGLPIVGLTRLAGDPVDMPGFLEFITNKATYSNKRAAELLDWRPMVSLEKGMAHTEVWLKGLPS